MPTTAPAIEPYVQDIVASTNGILYRPLVGRLKRYPIPNLRLPDGNGALLLDIGCNWGRWSVAATRKGYRTVGVDLRHEALVAARRVGEQLSAPAAYACALGAPLPFQSSSFDVVFSYSVFQHNAESRVRAMLREVRRVLKPGGTSLIQMPNRIGIRTLYQQARREFRYARGGEVRFWSIPKLHRTFNRLIGPTTISVEGFFGLGVGAGTTDLPIRYRAVVHASELLRRMSLRIPALTHVSDSVYVLSRKPE